MILDGLIRDRLVILLVHLEKAAPFPGLFTGNILGLFNHSPIQGTPPASLDQLGARADHDRSIGAKQKGKRKQDQNRFENKTISQPERTVLSRLFYTTARSCFP